MNFGLNYSSEELKILEFFCQQIRYADHDSERILIIRRKTLLPRNLRDTAREIGGFWASLS